jgi:hypothetical protein
MQLGAKHVESPFIEFGQISTVIYFAYFLVIIPVISLLENSLVELPTDAKEISSEKSTSFNVLQNKFTILSTSFVVILLTLQSKLFSVDYCDSPRP